MNDSKDVNDKEPEIEPYENQVNRTGDPGGSFTLHG